MRALSWIWKELTRPRGKQVHRIHGAARARGSERGIALLMVLTTLVFMIVLVTEIAYSSRVRFLKAAHERDDIAARYLAQSGLNLYRLVLVADKQLSSSSMGSMLAGAGDAASANEGTSANLSLWTMVPAINTGLLRMFFVTDGDVDEDEAERFATEGLSEEEVEESRAGGHFSKKTFLDFEGDFAAEISDEDRKVNITRLGQTCGGPCTLTLLQSDPVALQLYALMSGEENDQWFYDKDVDRWELIANLLDWMDEDTDRIFRGGYEDSLYNNLDSPYLSKNAKFDTMDEIRLVDGWQDDDLMERFGEQITIYGDGKININTADEEMMKALLRGAFTTSLSDQDAAMLLTNIQDYTMIGEWSGAEDFVNYLKNNSGRELRDEEALKNSVKTSSTTFRVESTGMVAESTASVVAVLDFSNSKVGRVKYWRVD